jgi:SAM-dependent methyltransferase
MAFNAIRLTRLMLREAILPRRLGRIPEPTAEMASAESISGFREQGMSSLLPIYHFNARAIDSLARRGARILDLGCGTGKFLAYLAAHRPDLSITGLDLAEDMVRVGQRDLADAGLDGRVRLLHGDMRDFRRRLPERIDLIISVFSMHHLTTQSDLLACLREIGEVVKSEQALLWIFDHVRPRCSRTVEEVPEIFTPDASTVFRRDSRNSLRASWSFEELKSEIRNIFSFNVDGARSRFFPLYQIHWIKGPLNMEVGPVEWIEDNDLSRSARLEAAVLSRLFRMAPI